MRCGGLRCGSRFWRGDAAAAFQDPLIRSRGKGRQQGGQQGLDADRPVPPGGVEVHRGADEFEGPEQAEEVEMAERSPTSGSAGPCRAGVSDPWGIGYHDLAWMFQVNI